MDNRTKVRKKKVNFKILAKRGLFCCALLYLCFLLISQQFDIARLSKKENGIDSEIAAAQKQATELDAQKEAAGTDEYLERVAVNNVKNVKCFRTIRLYNKYI